MTLLLAALLAVVTADQAPAIFDGLTHAQEFSSIDQVFAKEVEFTRALPR